MKKWLPAIHMGTALLLLSMFATGFSGLVFESILATVSSYTLGNSAEQWSIVLGLMMLMMGVGGLVQTKLSNEGLVTKFIAVETLLAIIGGFAPIATYAAYGTLEHSFALIHYGLIASIGFLIGFEIPLVMRINEEYTPALKKNVGWTFGLDYIGGFCGAIAYSFYFLRTFPLPESSFIIAGINLLIAIITGLYFWNKQSRRQIVFTAASLATVLLALATGFTQNRQWEMDLQQRLYDDPIVWNQTTQFQQLVLTRDTTRKPTEYRLFINGNVQFSSRDEVRYHEQLVHPVMHMAPRHSKVLVLGGGDGLAVRELVKYPNITDITLVDLDPAMVQFAQTHEVMRQLNHNAFADARVTTIAGQGVTAGEVERIYQQEWQSFPRPSSTAVPIANVHVLHVDADKFVETGAALYDVIIIDLPDPNSVELAKLYSKEFFLKLKRVLAPNGLFAIQSTSPLHAKYAFLCIRDTIEAAGFATLPYHDYIPSFGDWGWIIGGRHADQLKAADAVDALTVQTAYLTPQKFQAARVFGIGELDSPDVLVNTLMQPRLLDIYLNHSWQEG